MQKLLRVVALLLAGTAMVFAQSPVVGVGTFIHVVADLDKTIRFYGDRLGLELNGAPGPRAFSANAVVENLYDARGSQSRVAVLKIPGSPLGLEFVEFKGVSQKAVRPRLQDPGASVVVLSIRDVNSVISKLKEDGMPVSSDGMAQDPDGFFVQLVEGAPGAKLRLTVDSMDRTLRVFRDLLGFPFEVGPGNKARVPGTEFEVEFAEFKNKDRRSNPTGIHDPGAGVLRLVVRDVDALLTTLKGAGVPAVSVGGDAVSVGSRHFVILRDPDNFFFQLVPQPNPGR